MINKEIYINASVWILLTNTQLQDRQYFVSLKYLPHSVIFWNPSSSFCNIAGSRKISTLKHFINTNVILFLELLVFPITAIKYKIFNPHHQYTLELIKTKSPVT